MSSDKTGIVEKGKTKAEILKQLFKENKEGLARLAREEPAKEKREEAEE